jgi:putative transposase
VWFAVEQTIRALKESSAGAEARELSGKHGISEAAFYSWKGKYGGTTALGARRLKELESENAKLKGLRPRAEGAEDR